jgi:C-terminal processing protease CtpA/Prc
MAIHMAIFPPGESMGMELKFRQEGRLGYLHVDVVDNDSPAASAGVVVGSALVAVDGKPTTGLSADDVLILITANKGERRLAFRPPSGEKAVVPGPWPDTIRVVLPPGENLGSGLSDWAWH